MSQAQDDETELERLTLVDILRWRAQHEPQREAYTFLLNGEIPQAQMTYADLDRQAGRIAALLHDRVAPGERVLLLYQPGLEYVAAVFGCFYAGVVAVPAYPPHLDRSLQRIQSIFQDARASAALTTSTILSSLRSTFASNPFMQDLQWIATDTMDAQAVASNLEACANPKALALLQYTSGSTGSPKGVMLTHTNLVQNAALLQEGFSLTSQDRAVSWLPPYHDMGLMFGLLQTVYTGYPTVLMTPAAFVQRPARWLQAISAFQATFSGGPNFAFDLCVKKATPETIAALDLSSWMLAFNGAEPVRAGTLQRFAETFADAGFRPERFYPCYGMAETTLFVSGGRRDEKPSIQAFDGEAIENGYVVEAKGGQETSRLLVGCGYVRPGLEVAIVDPQTHTRCASGTIGEIWVKGPSVALGYWGKAEETVETFQAFLQNDEERPFLRTGDLGFFVDNELFIAGRLKDLIIIRGRNLYPQDIEQVVEESHPLLRQGCCAAFALEGPDTEQLVIVQEMVHQWDDNAVRGKEVIQAICQAVRSEFHVEVEAVELLRAGTISKTSSGKIQRRACRSRFLAGELNAVYSFRHTSPSQSGDANGDNPSPEAVPDTTPLVDWLIKHVAERAHMDAHAVDIHKPFVTFGLNSLEAIGLSNELEQWLRRSLSPTLFYEYPSLSTLARSLEGSGEGTEEAERSQGISRPPLPTFTAQLFREKANESRELEGREQAASFASPLSYNQKAFWFHSRLASESVAYNLLYAVRIRFCLDVAALQRALSVLASRHPILTSAYALQNGEPVQQTRDNQPLLQEIDATSRGLDDLKVLLEEESNRPIDLREGPVFRLQLYRRADDDYLLGFLLHHIVADFWALDLLREETQYLYLIEKASLDSPLGLAPDRWPQKPGLQHTDYVRWQQSMLQGEEGEYHWQYWQNALAGDLPVLHLPTDRPRPAVQTYNGASHNFSLSTDLEKQLRSLANETQVTLFTLMLTAYQVLLHRYSHQDDILVGIPALGRTHSELEHVIGSLTNPIVVRARFGHHSTFKELLHQTERGVLSALEHQDFPFSLLVERLQPVRDPSTSPIYQILFVWNRLRLLSATPVLSWEPFAQGQQGTIVDLSLTILETEGGVSANFSYNVDLFDASTISRMAKHFLTLLDSLVNNPDQHLREIPLLPESERRTLLVEWNATSSVASSQCDHQGLPTPWRSQDLCVHQLFEQQVERTPDAIALVFEDQELTYAELNRCANQLAYHLQTLGVCPEVAVGICLLRSLQMIVGLLAILKTGSAYLPLDPAYPPDRLASILEHAQVPVLITEQHLRTRIPAGSASLVLVDADASLLAQQCDTNPQTAGASDNLAYIIYTSGSTGRPKGVLITHASLLNLIFWHQQAFNVACSDRATQIASPAFDAMGWEVWPYLVIGASVFLLANEEVRVMPSLLCDWLMRHAITITFLPTALAESVLDQKWPTATALRFLLTGADALRRYPPPGLPFALINNYGPTEATVVATAGLVPPRERDIVPPSIGCPIANIQIYILDKHLQPTPIGIPGEIYIGGTGLARGYFEDAVLTAEKFLPSPFVGIVPGADPGARLYHPGDLARYRPDGTIEYLGRSDNQVKLRGFRIELGEIEATLQAAPGVQDTVVVLREDRSLQASSTGTRKYLVAYVVAQAVESLTSEREARETIVRDYLRERLPDYMVPTFVVFLEKLPLTPNGKVDRKALPMVDPAQHHQSETWEAPHFGASLETMLQELLGQIWRDVLGIECQVGIHDHFFQLGGHSLLATQVVARIRQILGVDVPLRSLFEAPTIVQFAHYLEEVMSGVSAPAGLAGSGAESCVILRPMERPGNPPLSFAQERLWFLDQWDPGTAWYNVPMALRLSGLLHVRALEESLATIVQRHEVLRTTFDSQQGRPVQVIAVSPPPLVQMPVIDLCGLASAQRDQQVRQLAHAEAQRSFDLAHGPLMRVYVLRLETEQEYVFLLTLHHIVTDGWSMRVLAREITTLYQAQVNGEPSDLPELPIQYADYTLWQRQWLQGAVLDEQLAYWRKQLADVSPLELPTDHPRPAVKTHRGASQSLLLPKAVSVELLHLCQKLDVTLFMLGLSAFQVLLMRYTGQTDICVGTPIANRRQAELESLIGFFVNTLVLRTDLSGNPTFLELLRRVREVCLQAYTHQDIPFEKVVEEIEPPRETSRSPLFQVLFVLQHSSGEGRPVQGTPPTAFVQDMAGVAMEQMNVESTSSKFDLTLSLVETERGLHWKLEYSTDLFEAETITRILSNFQTLLEGIVHDPQTPLADLPLLTEAERNLLLVEWNATQTGLPLDVYVDQLIERHVELTPDAIALATGEEMLTYGELNQRANQLAHYLHKLEVGPEVLVGLCMERSIEMVMALLAVLKAGAAYIPLDPSYPQARLASLLADAQPLLLLSMQEIQENALPFVEGQIFCLDRDWERVQGESAENLAPCHYGACRRDPANPAYLIYTSGSTGQPKGVLVEHQQLSNYTWAMIHQLELKKDRTFALLQPLTVDFSVTVLFSSLCTGGCLHIILREQALDPQAMQDLFKCFPIDCLKITPSHLAALHASAEPEQIMPQSHLVIGGEASRWDWAQGLSRLSGSCTVINHYGPTETTVGVLTYHLNVGRASLSTPLGYPIANTQAYVLDAQMQLLPVGVWGELCIAGLALARGYLHRPDLTAERFVPHPFSRKAGARLYRTGDLVRYRADGAIEYRGRMDQQVKVRGYRIELGEIEAVLREHPAIQDTAVLARKDESGNVCLVAYLVKRREQSVGQDTPMSLVSPATELRFYLQDRLPSFMIPHTFVFLDALPLTPHGKLDLNALPRLDATRSSHTSDFVRPHTSVEMTLATIWSQVLTSVGQVGIHDNFFELGGDSILSLQIIAHARLAGLYLTPKQLFQHQTIAQLARVVEPIGQAQDQYKQREQAEVIGPVPLTPIQRRFFALDLPQPQHYNQSVLLQVPASWELRHLQQVVDTWFAQHDAFRLRYEYTETGWQQRLISVAEAGTVTVECIDLAGGEANGQAAAIEEEANRVQASLDIEHGPLLRAALFDLGNGQPARLLIVIHHLAVDGVSWRVLLEQMQAAMAQLQQGKALVFPGRTASFQHWAEHVQELAQSTLIKEERAYWLKTAQVATPPLPLDFSQGSAVQRSAQTVSVTLKIEETGLLLQEACLPYRSSVQELLLVALLQTLARWMGTRQIRLDLEGHGREELGEETLDMSRTVGWFTSLYPVLFTLPQEGGPDTWIKTIKEQLRSVPHKGIGYGLLRFLNEDREQAELLACSAEVSFNYLGQFDQVFSGGEELQLTSESSGKNLEPQNQRSHLLDVTARISGGQFHLQWIFSEQLHQHPTIERLASAHVQALRALLAHCLTPGVGGRTPSDFPLVCLDQATLDRFLSSHGQQVEDVYPLTPLQQGLFFHTLHTPRSGVYVEQISCVLRGEVEVGTFELAWQQVIARHAILRTAFVWQELPEPLQIVTASVKLPFSLLDWRDRSRELQEANLEAFLQADRREGFDLGQAPLMRLTLARLSETRTQMIWTHHHLLLDGWSLSLVVQEVLAGYAAERQGKRLVHEERRPYRDYIRWLAQQDDAAAETYWRQRLSGVETPTPLEIDRKGSKPVERDPSRQGYAEEVLQIEAATTARWQEYARQQHMTLNTLMQAAWAVVLSCYSGQTDVVFGAVVAGRPPELAGVERMIGLFINTVPVRVHLDDDEEVGVWLTRLQEQQIEQRSYESSPLVQVQDWSRSHRAGPNGQDRSDRRPLFESLFIFENYPVQQVFSEDGEVGLALEVETLQVREQTNYPLTIYVVPGMGRDHLRADPESLLLRVSYDRQRFEQAAIERFLWHMQTVLQQLVSDPQQKVGEVSLLTDREREQVLAQGRGPTRQWNAISEWEATNAQGLHQGGASPWSSQEMTLHQLFEQQVERTPDAVALVFEEAILTYRQLNERANQLAHFLRKRGVGPEERVGLCVERSLEMVVGILGILKAEGAYVPLDPAYPKPRLAFMLDDAQTQVLVTQQRLLSILPRQKNVVCLDTDWSLITQESKEQSATATCERLFSLLYTSGSTGQPKGVLATYRATINRLHWMWTTYPFQAEEVCCQKTALSFVDSVWEIFGPLLKGIRTLIIAEPVVKDPKELLQTLATHGVTRLVLVPSLLRALLETIEKRDGWLPNLNYCVCSGETLPLDLARRFRDDMPECVLLNLYGSSEVAADVTYFDTRQDHEDLWSVPIGRPIANTQIYLLDRNLQPVPIGIAAEVFIGGVNLAWGYQNRADLTAERFVPNPFRGGERLYRTGDLARYRAGGALEYLGRIDHQVKLRGFRIELGEIKATLRAYPAVQEAVVLLREYHSPAGNWQYLAAYVVACTDESLTTREENLASALLEYLHEQLPDYMVPTSIVFLETLPFTPNGKIDRKALPIPERREMLPGASNPLVAPQTPLQEQLALIWSELLHLPQPGIHDNFFKLGGHSLLATQLMASLRNLFQVEIPLRYLFEKPTLAELALVIEQMQRAMLGQTEDERLAQMLIEMGGLSEDDMHAIFTDDQKIEKR